VCSVIKDHQNEELVKTQDYLGISALLLLLWTTNLVVLDSFVAREFRLITQMPELPLPRQRRLAAPVSI